MTARSQNNKTEKTSYYDEEEYDEEETKTKIKPITQRSKKPSEKTEYYDEEEEYDEETKKSMISKKPTNRANKK